MILWVSQAPILAVLLPVFLFVALFELVGLKARLNILVLALISLACLGTAAGAGAANHPLLAELLYAVGAALSVTLALYAPATARRGKQWPWFTGVLAAGIAALVAGLGVRAVVAEQDVDTIVTMTYALTFIPAASALLYGLFAPDVPQPRGRL